MAKATGKDHARVNLDIWGDDDWLDLTAPAQHLYFVLWTSPELSYCGTGDWHPARIAMKARGWSPDAVMAAGMELSQELFIVIDPGTDEFILRSWMKHDGLWRTPNMAVSMANARAALASRILRAVVVHEVRKLKAANPDSTSWARDAVAKMLTQKGVDAASLDHYNPWPKGAPKGGVNPWPNGASNPGATADTNGRAKGGSNGGATPAPAPNSSSILQKGYVSRERHQSAPPDSNAPFPNRCPRHWNDPNPGKCGDCADARRADKALKDALKAAAVKLLADCPDCDEDGWLIADLEIRCDHRNVEVAHG